MTSTAIEALKAEREVLLRIGAGLTEADWQAPSGCEGWSTKDVVAHMGALYWMVVDPSNLPDTAGRTTEAAQDFYVQARRAWGEQQVLDDYTEVSSRAIEQLEAIEGLDMEMPLGDLGTYRASLLPNAFAFDHYTHIRADLFAPRGSLATTPPPSDELRLVPALDWIEAALGQQNVDTIATLPGAVELVVEGVAGRAFTIGSGPQAGQVASDAPSFVRWITQRGAWDDLGVKASGDERALTLVKTLKVF